MAKFYKLQIKNIEKITAQAVAITFDVPNNLEAQFKFKAGQYVTLKTQLNNEEVRRDYSICSSVNSGDITVGIKAVEGGLFSVYANTVLKAGDTVEVSEPQGRFIFEANKVKSRTIVAFAAGSGITPILGIGKTLLEDELFSNFILVYGNKSLKDAMFAEDLLKLKNSYGNRIHIHYVYSRDPQDNALFGRIEKHIVNLIIKNKYKDVQIERFYLCGPEGMINAVKEVLQENNYKDDQILFELFTAVNSNDASPSPSDNNNTQTLVKLSVDFETFEFEMSKQQSILEAALKQHIDAPYSCQGGICSSCVAQITEGKAIMRQNNVLTDTEIEAGLTLTCQAYPITDSIAVDYDDI